MDFKVFLGITSVVLLLSVIFLVYRIATLSSAINNSGEMTDESSANKINAILFPIFFVLLFGLFFWYSPKAAKFFLPESASVHGVESDKMFWLVIYIISAVVLITHFLLFLFPFLYQYKKGRKVNYYPENHMLELGWTIAPALVLSGLIAYGWSTWSTITGPTPKDAVELEIMGFQFAWKVRYPGKDGKFGKYYFRNIQAGNDLGLNLDDTDNFDDFIPNEIHIPVGQPVKFNIRARDVIHSVFLPHFRQKMDAVPGMPTSLWFIPKYTTAQMREITKNSSFNYELACTEVCGKGHYSMRYIVVVDSKEDYQKWYNSNKSWLTDNQDIINKISPDKRKFIPGYSEKIETSTQVSEVTSTVETSDTSKSSTETNTELTSEGVTKEVAEKFVAFSNGIYFGAATAKIKEESFDDLDNLVSLLKANSKVKAEVQGHTDKLGVEFVNKKLSQNRAEAVVNYLVSKGIDASRLTPKGFGSSVPVASGDNEESRAKNRRVVFKLSAK